MRVVADSNGSAASPFPLALVHTLGQLALLQGHNHHDACLPFSRENMGALHLPDEPSKLNRALRCLGSY
jgi:hypothetical protein